MLLPVFRDLIKPQWRVVLEELKQGGGMSVADLARATGGSYMAVKAHCEALTRSGYLVRTRLPRTEVGRPEIFYSLGARADALFPQAGDAFALDLLGHLKRMYGEHAPEKLFFQYFEQRRVVLVKALGKVVCADERAERLVALRGKEGCAGTCEREDGTVVRIVERHNPLQRVFDCYPRAVAMELRMLEQVLDRTLARREVATGRESAPHVVFEMVRE